jgi:hypothetical protein
MGTMDKISPLTDMEWQRLVITAYWSQTHAGRVLTQPSVAAVQQAAPTTPALSPNKEVTTSTFSTGMTWTRARMVRSSGSSRSFPVFATPPPMMMRRGLTAAQMLEAATPR